MMINNRLGKILLLATGFIAACGTAFCANNADITVEGSTGMNPGNTKPIWVSMSGITGEAAQAIQFDLYVQGFGFTNADGAQYLISGSANGNLTVHATDKYSKATLVSKAYSGASLRKLCHAFADDFVVAMSRKPIAQTKIAFRGGNGPSSEIYIADFDGHSAQAVTRDNSLAISPDWVPHHLALFYTSYRLGNPDIFYHDLSTGSRKAVARYGGSNLNPAVSPDGSKVAMILSKDGWTDLYVANSDGSGLKRLTKSRQDESSPCWSPDGKWICYASKDKEFRGLSRISPNGGAPQRIPTTGAPNPTEPDWSPDGKLIAFTMMTRSGFAICVVPSTGGMATVLTEGEDPSWSANSRTLIFTRRHGSGNALALLDVMTKQQKDISRSSGISSQSQPSWAK